MLQNGWNGKNDWDSNLGLLNLLSGASLTEVSGTADQLGWLSRKPKILTQSTCVVRWTWAQRHWVCTTGRNHSIGWLHSCHTSCSSVYWTEGQFCFIWFLRGGGIMGWGYNVAYNFLNFFLPNCDNFPFVNNSLNLQICISCYICTCIQPLKFISTHLSILIFIWCRVFLLLGQRNRRPNICLSLPQESTLLHFAWRNHPGIYNNKCD